MIRVAAIASLCAISVSAFSPSDYARVEAFQEAVRSAGGHLSGAVPESIRGENFTVGNLVRYFDMSATPLMSADKSESVTPFEEVPPVEVSGVDPATVIQIGKQIWDFVVANRPVTTVTNDWAGAVPAAVGSSWTSMAGWRGQTWGTSNPFNWVYKNGFGMTAIDFAWSWNWKCGGSYQNTGRYVTQASATIQRLNTLWGQSVDVTVKAYPPLNAGTISNPNAEIDLEVVLKNNNILQTHQQTCRVTMRGDCSGRLVGCDGVIVGK